MIESTLSDQAAAEIRGAYSCANFNNRVLESTLPLDRKAHLIAVSVYMAMLHKISTNAYRSDWSIQRDNKARDNALAYYQSIQKYPELRLRPFSLPHYVKTVLNNLETYSLSSTQSLEVPEDTDTWQHKISHSATQTEPVTEAQEVEGVSWALLKEMFTDTKKWRQNELTVALRNLYEAGASEDYIIGLLTAPPAEAARDTGISSTNLISQRLWLLSKLRHFLQTEQTQGLETVETERKQSVIVRLRGDQNQFLPILSEVIADDSTCKQNTLTKKMRDMHKSGTPMTTLLTAVLDSDIAKGAENFCLPRHEYRKFRDNLLTKFRRTKDNQDIIKS
jgi:hypothetical protein